MKFLHFSKAKLTFYNLKLLFINSKRNMQLMGPFVHNLHVGLQAVHNLQSVLILFSIYHL